MCPVQRGSVSSDTIGRYQKGVQIFMCTASLQACVCAVFERCFPICPLNLLVAGLPLVHSFQILSKIENNFLGAVVW